VKTILLADDEANLRKLVRTTLEDPRYRIVEAPDGKAALELVRKEHPDLLVLDWMMPGMTGIEVAKVLVAEESNQAKRIIMLTAKGQEKDREEASALGIRHYLIKPFSPRELLERVEAMLQRAALEE
jgi:two-component system phosphate regulon response regulator PhoB